MKKLFIFVKKHYVSCLLIIFTVITTLLHFYKLEIPCLNADDVSFGYNAYSIATTGKDEYGTPFPLRFKAFGENKLPVLVYLTAPITAILGTSDFAIRLPLHLVGIIFPLALFLLSKQIFKNNTIALLTTFLASVSSWIQITTRHSHEVSLSALFIVFALTFLLKYLESRRLALIVWLSIFNGLSLFTYHLGKLIQPFIFGWLAFYVFFKKGGSTYDWKKLFLILAIPVLFFVYSEYKNPTNRIGNLVFYKNQGFVLSIEQKRGEDNNRILNNKLVEGVQVVSKNYLSYFSPGYLSFTGDDNPRFWYEGMGPITPVEYLFLLIGLYFLFRHNHKQKYFLLSLLLWAPFSAALAWAGSSMTRNFLSIVPILLITSYGFYSFSMTLNKNRWRILILFMIFGMFAFYRITTWNFYFNHYPKRALVIRATECGYNELAQYIKQNYSRFKTFYITRQHGQPYAHLLYNLQYPATKYQSQAKLTEPDKYGFGQVERFDKFVFSLPNDLHEKGVVYIGYPEEITGRPGYDDSHSLKSVRVGSEVIFSILEK